MIITRIIGTLRHLVQVHEACPWWSKLPIHDAADWLQDQDAKTRPHTTEDH